MKFRKNVKIKDILEFSGPMIEAHLADLETEIQWFGSHTCQKEKAFAFINTPRNLGALEKSAVICVLAPLSLKEQIEKSDSRKNWLFSRNVGLAARNIKKHFVFETPYRRTDYQGIHSTAIIDESSEISPGVVIGPNVVIGKNCRLGEGTYIGANTVIEENVVIKSHVTIHPLVYIGHSCEIGHHCEIKSQAIIGSEGYGYEHDHLGNHYRVPHTGRVVLMDDVHVGAGSALDRGTINDTVIGQGTKIDNQCHLAHNTVVGKNGLITAQAVTAGSSTIGDNFICGGKTAITGHITICDNVNLAGFSAVTNDVKEPGQYGGYPLLPLTQHLKIQASRVHIPKMRKQMRKVMKKLFPEDCE